MAYSDLATFWGSTFIPDRLIVRTTDLFSLKGTLAAGQNLVRGALLGVITASGELTLSVSTAEDGSQVPDRILAEDADATAGACDALCYLRGQFNALAMTFGAGQTVANCLQTLRSKGIDLVTPEMVNPGT